MSELNILLHREIADVASSDFTMYFCHSAAIFLQSTMSGQCLDTYEDCINK